MTTRIGNPLAVASAAYKAAIQLESAIKAGVDETLYYLVKTRASQINGCAYCIHMHTTDARKHGESEMRLYMLDAWRESSLYTPRERAALAWTECVTRIAETGAPDADYAELAKHFNEAEIAHLTLLIAMINYWNRQAIALRAQHPVHQGDQRAA